MAMSRLVTANPRLTAPLTSKRTSVLRGVSGSSGIAASNAISEGTAWMKKMVRQPKASTTNPPNVTPMAGERAVTADQ